MLWSLYSEVTFDQIGIQVKTHPRRMILKALTNAAYSQFCSSVLYSRKNSKNFVRKKIICIVPNNFSVTFFNEYTGVHGRKSVRSPYPSGDTNILCSFIIRRDWHDFCGIFSYSDNANILICSKCKYFTCRLFVYSYYSLVIHFSQEILWWWTYRHKSRWMKLKKSKIVWNRHR